MSFREWHTLEEVTQDLARASGQHVPSLSKKHLVIGHQRPKYSEDEFEEMHNYENCDLIKAENKPDLRGITEMLRMVDNYSIGESCLDETENIKKMKNTFNNETVIITKLNPEVPEFIPKLSQNLVQNERLSNEESQTNMDTTKDFTMTKQTNDDYANPNNSSGQIDIPSTSNIDISSLDPVEKEKLQKHLRSNISKTSNTNSVKDKRQRNLAIATLMKLFSTPSPTKATEVASPKLMTPEYYNLKPISDEVKVNDKDTTDRRLEYTNKIEDNHSDDAIDKVNKWLERRDLSSTDDNKLCDSQNTSDTSISHPDNVTNNVSPADVKDSIEKVNKWLNGPEAQSVKSPILFVGTVTFKKKHASKSTVTQTSTSNESKGCEITENYVPSAYASQLTEKYMKHEKERKVTKDIWTKLEEDLKLKDEIIRNKSLSSLGS